MKKTLVYIAPHLSTGGMPQYLFKQIESVINDFDVYCIEWDNVTGGVLVVQRNRIQSLLGNKLITLGENKEELFTILKNINPDVVHLQEIPELFMPTAIATRLYSKGRNYVLIETSHDSSYDITQKTFLPDKFLMVSQYQIDQYTPLGIPLDLVEYPIENKVRTKTREQALRDLGLDPNLKHVINVGLFTPRKNQAEVIEYARLLQNYPIQFHFLGNHADNFKHYWEPLMQNFPKNCKWWNERSDVDAFYEAADLFLFTSKGNSHDKETMPLVIREALSWKTPSMIYNLPVYMGYFDKYSTIEYLSDDTQKNAYRIAEKLVATVPAVDSYFDFKFAPTENKITMTYKGQTPLSTKVVVKDKDSNAPIYWMDATFEIGSSYWMIPTPLHIFDFANDPSFSTLLIEIYTPDEKLLFTKDIPVKDATKKRTVYLDITNPFDCLFNNYNEMFVERKYDCYNLNNLDVVLDIGANAGLFSLLMVQQGAKKVYAFEPNQQSLVNLRHMFRNTDAVEIVEKAVYTSDEPLEFFINPNNTTIGSVSETHVLKSTVDMQKITVPAISLQTFIADTQLDKISLIKMDIEGAEYTIMEQLDKNIYDKVDSFLIEFHDNSDGRVVKLIDILNRNGYDITQIRNQSSNTNELITYSYQFAPIGTLLAVKTQSTLTRSSLPVGTDIPTPNPILIVDAFFHDDYCVTTFKQYLASVKRLNVPIMLITNSKFDTSLIDEVDYVVYDSNNRLFKKSYDGVDNIVLYTIDNDKYLSLGTPALQKHGLSVLSNLYHSTNLAKSLGYTHFYRIEYDCQLDDVEKIAAIPAVVQKSGKKGLVYVNQNKYVSYQLWYMELDYFTTYFPQINSEDDYPAAKKAIGATKDFVTAEEFIYHMIDNSHGGLSSMLVRGAVEMHTDYGNCTWNTITSPSESDKIVDGCVSTICRITVENDAIRSVRHTPRPDWEVTPEVCEIYPSKVAFTTWNVSSDGTNTSVATLTYPDGTIKVLRHSITGMGGTNIDIIDVIDGDIVVDILINDHTTYQYIINKNTISRLTDVYQPRILP